MAALFVIAGVAVLAVLNWIIRKRLPRYTPFACQGCGRERTDCRCTSGPGSRI
jgi:hypothetical protein